MDILNLKHKRKREYTKDVYVVKFLNPDYTWYIISITQISRNY